MNIKSRSKSLPYSNYRESVAGFTLIELLVAIVIIGILSGIALPHFLNQTSKAKQAEAKQNLGTLNKAQNAYRQENNSFASTFDLLAIGSVKDGATAGTGTTVNYSYTLSTNPTDDTANVVVTATDAGLRGYAAAITRFANSAGMNVHGSVLCEATAASTATPTAPTAPAGSPPTCGSNTTRVGL